MNQITTEKLFQDFREQFRTKYSFESQESLGGGAYGIVFKATDIDRNIDVAIKFYHDGLVPTGSERGWNLSSKTINHQIAPTYTIETYLSGGSKYKAVVSRFIPGKSLRQIFDWCNEQEPDNKERIAEDLAHTFLPSLLQVLELCHSLGFGHGDLHEGNIMVFPVNFEIRFSFSAVLIDFDNSSIETEAYCATEKEKIEKDVRLFSSRLAPYILMDWLYLSETEIILKEYKSIRDIKIAFTAVLSFIELINKNSFNKENTIEILGNLVPYSMNQFSPKATIDSLSAIAEKVKKSEDFYKYLQDFYKGLANPENIVVDVGIIKDGHIRNELYKSFFN